MRKKSDRTNQTKSVKFNNASLLTDQNCLFAVLLDATLTGDNFGPVSDVVAAETALEADTSATALTGGTAIRKQVATTGGGNKESSSDLQALGLDLPDETNITLAAKTISGNGTVSAVMTLEEEW